jgi:hypothetical protein
VTSDDQLYQLLVRVFRLDEAEDGAIDQKALAARAAQALNLFTRVHTKKE